jgi:hypothetical protein
MFRPRAMMFASRSVMHGWRSLMLGWRSLTHDSSHSDARSAHVEARLVAARSTTRRGASYDSPQAIRGLSHGDAAFVAPRRGVVRTATWSRSHCDAAGVALRHDGCRTATSRTSDCARTTTRYDETEIRAREMNVALRRGGHQNARDERRAATRWVSHCDKACSGCDTTGFAPIRARHARVRSVSR